MYPGGVTYWQRYLQRNLQYPSEALRKNVQGTVVTKFIVDTNGAVHDVTAISGPDELRAETIRIIKNVDIWVPAVCNGNKVNSWKNTICFLQTGKLNLLFGFYNFYRDTM
ncbi:MAG: energy transducer TonB [Puia sp.]